MTVSRQNQLPAPGYGCQNGRNQAAGAAVYQQIGRLCPIHRLITMHDFQQRPFRLKQVIRTGDFRNIAVHQSVEKVSVAALPVDGRAFMPGHMERNRMKCRVLQQKWCDGVFQRSGLLVIDSSFAFRIL